jgi:YidC/Oxa1 family membrane protein insertase
MGTLFNTVLVTPITNILLLIYHLLVYLHIPSPLGFSIILLTVVIRLILYPLTASQLKATKKMQTLTPHLSRLKEQHKNDAKRLQEETMALYKEHGVNPAAGCLPLIIQLPVIWGLYAVLQKIVGLKPDVLVKTVNDLAYAPFLHLAKPWDTSFFGLPLTQTPGHLFTTGLYFIILVPALTAVLQFVQTKMMLPPQTEEKKKSTGGAEDFAQAFQTQSLYMFPLMIGFFSFQFPLGLSLYWNTFTLFAMIQQYKMKPASQAVQVKEIESTKAKKTKKK